MSQADLELSVVSYYAQRGQYHTLHRVCETALKRRSADPVLMFWRAFGLFKQGKPSEAIREFQQLQDKRDLILACPLAMISAHEKCKLIGQWTYDALLGLLLSFGPLHPLIYNSTDYEAIQELQAKHTIASNNPSLSERALLQAAMLYWHTGQQEHARLLLRRIIDGPNGAAGAGAKSDPRRNSAQSPGQQPATSPMSPGGTTGGGAAGGVYHAALAIMGWVDLTCGQESLMAKSISWFDRVLESNPRDLDALMGKLQYLRSQRRQLTPALDITSQIIVYYGSFTPAYIERMYVLLEMVAWEQTVEAAQRLAERPGYDGVDATAVLGLIELCKEGRQQVAAKQISKLNEIIARTEPTNAELYFTTAQPFIWLSGRNQAILEESALMVVKAIDLDPTKSRYKTELGYIQLFLGNTSRASELFRQAATQNSTDTAALQAKSPEISYLSSLIAWYKYKNSLKQIKHLKEAFAILRKNITAETLSPRFYVNINPDLLLEIVREFVARAPSETKREGEDASPLLHNALEVLEEVCRIVPGSVEAAFYTAKVKFLMGDKQNAQALAASCLRLDASFVKAHILMAEIYLTNGQPRQAIQSLEMGLSYNFEVRHIPLFHILKAKALKSQSMNEEALSSLLHALNLPGIKELQSSTKKRPGMMHSDTTPTVAEHVTLYLELADVQSRLKHPHEAAKAMEDAMRMFAGTPEQERIIIANADLAVSAGDVETALNILSGIMSDQKLYVQARRRMADIYLNHKNDKKLYAKCFAEMAETLRTVETFLLLGDAYMNIQEPQKAISVYESALENNPDDTVLACKLGKALVKTHDYNRAISYYESALANDSPIAPILRFDLAELYFKLKQYDDSERIALEALEHPRSEDNLILEQDVRFHLLLAKSYRGAMKYEKAISALLKAREAQLQLVAKESGNLENSAYKVAASDICFEIAEVYVNSLRDTEKALPFYNESTKLHSMHKKAMVALSKLYMIQNDLAAAQKQCAEILRLDAGCEEATMMIADIMFKKNSYTSAVFHFRQLLEKNPTQYEALRQLIEMMRKGGKLEEAEKFFEIAEKSSYKVHLHPGFHFCKGLYYRYTNSPNEALKEFNHCRRDTVWGEDALYNMIEIFLNPDNETVGGDALEAVNDESSVSAAEKSDSELLAILTADKLLKELPQNPKSLKTQVLECHALMATKQKNEIERALARLTEILGAEKDYVPAILGLAVAHMLLKQPPRARNHLKRIAKMELIPQFSDEFERAWLLLSDVHIQGGKYDLATDLLRKCLAQNKSCAKAWEYMGFIMEKEASYKDAAEHYESAWKLERETNPGMGYKLAFNFLKARKNVEAIEVAHKVLIMYPDYPKIRALILEKARSQLRV
ncbi:Tetratricopeptide repeat protein 21B [Irineochytrium annulatum]|nr:Tetratricopeptide repeat protein 21B [Irineochytrium annulatum]